MSEGLQAGSLIFRVAAMLSMLFMSLPALAGGEATIETAGSATEPLRLSWKNSDVMRMNIPGQPGYIVVQNGNAYAVTTVNSRPVVLDLSATAGLLGGVAQAYGITGGQAVDVSSVEATGRKETVAGLEGEIYHVRWSDVNGDKRTDEAVLSDKASVVEMSNAFIAFATTNARAMGQPNADAIGRMLTERNLGVLRFADQFRVMTISNEAPPEAEFNLPAEPIALPGS